MDLPLVSFLAVCLNIPIITGVVSNHAAVEHFTEARHIRSFSESFSVMIASILVFQTSVNQSRKERE